MKKLWIVLVVGLLFLLTNSQTARAADTASKCILTEEEIEQESAFGWEPRSVLSSYEKDPDGTFFVYRTRRSYKKGNILLSSYSYFGKFGYKAWGCDENRDPLTWDTPTHGIAIKKSDNSWHYRIQAQKPNAVDKMYDQSGKLVGVLITLDQETVLIRR